MESELPRMGVPEDLMHRLSTGEQYEYLRARTSRRSMLRGGLMTGAGLAAGGLTIAGAAGAAAAPTSPELMVATAARNSHNVIPFGRHLAYGLNPRTQMNVAWQVRVPVQSPYLRLGRSPLDLGEKIKAEMRHLHTDVPRGAGPVDQFYLHAQLSHLLPDTTYYYGVGHRGFDPAAARNLPSIGSFTTGPRRGAGHAPAYTFTAFGDQGVTYDALANDTVIAGQQPRFHLHMGDLSYADDGGEGLPETADGANGTDEYDPRVWDAFFAQTELVAKQVPWMVATGNHDIEALYSEDGYGAQLARWDFPGGAPHNCPVTYSFIYGNVGVVVLDSNEVSNEIPANRGYSDGAQTTWLERRLKFLREQPDVDFVVVGNHYSSYSTTNQHASEGGIRSAWVPLFDRYKVDLVFNGHNHVYERTDPLRAGRVGRVAPIGSTIHPASDGTTYITAGGAGKSLYSFPVPDTYQGHTKPHIEVPTYYWDHAGNKVTETVPWSRVRYTGYSFFAVDVAPAAAGHRTTLTVRAITENGAEVDRFVLSRTAGQVSKATRGVDTAAEDLAAA